MRKRAWFGAAEPGSRKPGLKEGANRLAVAAQADPLRAVVDLLDRVGRNDAAAAGEPARTDGQCVRRLGGGAVHRALDPPDHAAPGICHEEAGGTAEIDGEGTHARDAIPRLRRNSPSCRKAFVRGGAGGAGQEPHLPDIASHAMQSSTRYSPLSTAAIRPATGLLERRHQNAVPIAPSRSNS